MSTLRDSRYEATFSLPRTPTEVWAALQLEQDGQPLWLTPFPNLQPDRPTAEIVETQPMQRIVADKVSEPCKGTRISVSLEPESGGTRITLAQAGFPDYLQDMLDVIQLGGDQIVADLALYLDRGVVLCRHALPWAFCGLVTRDVATGLEISAVLPGGFGERIGLEPGDRLLTLGGAPLFTRQCLNTLMRVLQSGTEVEASWVRERNLMRATATL